MRTRSSPQRDEVLNVLSRSSQRSFWKFPTFFLNVPRVLSPSSASLFVPSLFPPNVLSRRFQFVPRFNTFSVFPVPLMMDFRYFFLPGIISLFFTFFKIFNYFSFSSKFNIFGISISSPSQLMFIHCLTFFQCSI